MRDCNRNPGILIVRALARTAAGERDLGALGEADQNFLSAAAEDSQAEIQLCLVAEKRATNPALKAFARLMVDDHVEIERRLRVGSQRSAIKAGSDAYLMTASGIMRHRAIVLREGQVLHAHTFVV